MFFLPAVKILPSSDDKSSTFVMNTNPSGIPTTKNMNGLGLLCDSPSMNQNIDESIFQSVDISTFQEIINDINDHYENENNLSRVDHSIDNSPMTLCSLVA